MDTVLFNFHDVVLLLTIFCCAFAVGMFWLRREGHRYFNVLMTLFFISSACIPLDTIINFGAAVRPWAIENLPGIFFVFEYGAWIQAPLAYWFLRCLLEKDFRFCRMDILLLIPLVLTVSHQIIAYHSLPVDVKTSILQSNSIPEASVSIFYIQFIRDIFRCYVAWLSVSVIRQFFTYAHGPQRYGTPLGYEWLSVFGLGFLVMNVWSLLISSMLLIHVQFSIGLPIGMVGLAQNYFTCIVFMAVAVFYARTDIGVKCIKPMSKTMHKSRVGYAVNQVYVNSLEPLMYNDKIYTNPDLTLDLLAEKLGISARTLSNVINGHYGCNFFEYVNNYRVEEAKRLLSSHEFYKTSMLDIMYEVGFNSKATFNGFFKKVEGITPSEYRKQNVDTGSVVKRAQRVKA